MDLHNIDFTKALISAAALLIAVLGPLALALFRDLAAQGTAWLAHQVGEQRFTQLQSIAKAAVLAAEQSGLAEWAAKQIRLSGAEKKARAVAFAQAYLDHIGMKVDAQALETAIEAQVMYQFNQDRKAVPPVLPVPATSPGAAAN
jgi:hypothetical protein